MSPRIKKDLRNLMPEWVLAGILATIPLFALRSFGWSIGEIVPIHLLMLAIGCSWLGSAIIGKDVSLGILAFSFAHAESRALLWREKFRTLMILFGVILTGSIASLGMLSNAAASELAAPLPLELRFQVLVALSLVISVACAGGGIFFSLVLRSYQGAFWLTLLSPFAIAVVLIFPILLSSIPVLPKAYWGFVAFVTFAYGIILGVLARKQFLNWQDLGQWGGDIWFSPRSTNSSSKSQRKQIRRYRPLFGLARKELSLQQLNLVVAFALLVLYVAGAGIYNPVTQSPGEAALLAGFARALLLVFLPLAIGAISISEERRLKVDQWQQVLPSSSSYQWLVKVGMVYLVTAVSTVLAPLAFDSLFQEFWSRVAIETKTLYWIAIAVPFLAATLGLYASSLSNSYLVALGSSVVVSLLGIGAYYLGVEAILSAIVPNGMAIPQLLFVSLLLLLGLPLLWALSFYNYRTVRSLKPLIASNGTSWLVIFVVSVLATQLIYARAWERFTYRPPNPGAPINTQDVEPTIISGTWVTVLAPDGTLWTSQHHRNWNQNKENRSQLMIQIGERSAWIRAYSSLRNFYSLNRNGTLYRIPKWSPESIQPLPVPDPQPETTWQSVIGGAGHSPVIAIKSDGSLWQWMENEDRSISNPIPYLPDTRWRSVARDGYFFVGIRMDRTLWAWGVKSGFTSSSSVLQNTIIAKITNESNLLFPSQGLPEFEDERVKRAVDEFGPLLEQLEIDITDLENRTARSQFTQARYDEEKAFETPYQVGARTDWDSVRFSGRIVLTGYKNNRTHLNNVLIGTRSDGSIWAPTEGTPIPWRADKTSQSSEPFIQIDPDAVPKQIKYDLGLTGEELTLLTSTGNLAINPVAREGKVRLPSFEAGPKALSDRTDWISFAKDNYSIIALSADGLLWHSGPWPMKGRPGKILPFLVPSSSKLRPVFDFKTGKAM